jgi:farnesyl-diphosphate farnesyltransferase
MNYILKNFPRHPKELSALLRVKAITPNTRLNLNEAAIQMADMEFCYAALNKVSRSFAVVIQQLPAELRNPVCIFYLTLRGLDTIEDDMNLPLESKIELLQNFYKHCNDETLRLQNVGDTQDYRHLLMHYYKVARAFNRLEGKYQEVIADICRRMGEGMAQFAETKLHTSSDYNLYCHYVAGLVGYGLSGLFSASGVEDRRLKNQRTLSNSMGLMLQKTNIIRDYFEDLSQQRIFWFSDVWKKYTDDFSSFNKHPQDVPSLSCLNELVADALLHMNDCITYLQLLQNREVFRFCAIPQVMAIATLAEVYNNPNVFTSVVKIRKPLAAAIMVYTQNMSDVKTYLEQSLRQIEKKTNSDTPFGNIILQQVASIRQTLHHPKPYEWEPPLVTSVEQTVFF